MAPAILALSVLVGFFGQALFFDYSLGINAPFLALLMLGGAFSLLLVFERPLGWPNLLLGLPILALALFSAWTTEGGLQFWNLIMAGALLYLLARFAQESRFLGGASLWKVADALLGAAVAEWIIAPLLVLMNTARWSRQVEVRSGPSAQTQALLRGLLITLPVLVIFGALLASADAVFNDLLDGLFGWITDFDDLLARLFLWGFWAYICLIGYKVLLLGGLLNEVGDKLGGAVQGQTERFFRLGSIETGMVLGSVNALFALFVLIQARYFFGGEANITEAGYTYAEYARRGFFELILVACLALALIISLEALFKRETPQAAQMFRGLALLMIALTGVMLVSAFQRLSLYEEAFGYTRLRLMSHLAIVWLAVLLGVVVADLMGPRLRWFWAACVLVGVAYMLSLNLINMDGFIARNNIERYRETGKLDLLYLGTLSDDAAPELLRLLDEPGLPESERTMLRRYLGNRLFFLDSYREGRGVWDYHFGKERAWRALDARRGDLIVDLR
jgi:hypothetical protein